MLRDNKRRYRAIIFDLGGVVFDSPVKGIMRVRALVSQQQQQQQQQPFNVRTQSLFFLLCSMKENSICPVVF
jgi:hypothetical protein